MQQSNAITVGLDVGDKHSQVCILDSSGVIIEESRIPTTEKGIQRYFSSKTPARVTLEVGAHSPWISRTLKDTGHDVIVANARKVRLIHGASRKNDRLDAEKLARLTRYDTKLLAPIEHRSAQAQAHLSCIRSRDALVRTRATLVTHVRGSVKAFGQRLPSCTTSAFPSRAAGHIPTELRPALEPVLASIEALTERIKQLDKEIAEVAVRDYPSTGSLQQVPGVGLLTALAFQLVIEDPSRFSKSREVGPYLGLTPGEHQSGERNPKRRITKEGDMLLRRLLVQCAHYIIRSKTDSDLKRAAERIIIRGGHRAKAVTAVARKLSVLLHHLWVTGEIYQPLYNHPNSTTPAPPAMTASS
jgi:transposase